MLPTAALLLATALVAPDAGQETQRPFSEEILVEAPRSPEGYLLGWREYTSEHFVVDSDLATWAVTDLVRKLETLRAVELRSLLDQPAVLPGRVRVIASGASLLFGELAKDKYLTGSGPHCQTTPTGCQQLIYRELLSNDTACGSELRASANYFVSRLGEPTIVLPSGPSGPAGEVVAHELGHHLAAVLFLRPPPWFTEGFAMFLQTIGGEPIDNPPPTGTHIRNGGRVIEGAVGLVPPGFMAALCRGWLSSAELFVWDGEETSGGTGDHHIQSWLLYHWLWNMRSKQLADFQRRLASAEDPDAAWRQVFPEFDPVGGEGLRSLDNALYRHRMDPRGTGFRRKADAVARYAEAPLAPSDVHALLIDARYSVQPRKTQSAPWLRPELIKLLQEDPHQAVALSWRAQLDGTSALDELRKAVEKRPGDWRAWLLLGEAEERPHQKQAAYQMAVRLSPDSALAQERLALQLARNDQPADAVAFAKRALELARWDTDAAATLARVDAALGACDEANEARDRAVALAGGDRALDQLEDAVARCVPSPDNVQ